jgi:hypothetical protein
MSAPLIVSAARSDPWVRQRVLTDTRTNQEVTDMDMVHLGLVAALVVVSRVMPFLMLFLDHRTYLCHQRIMVETSKTSSDKKMILDEVAKLEIAYHNRQPRDSSARGTPSPPMPR